MNELLLTIIFFIVQIIGYLIVGYLAYKAGVSAGRVEIPQTWAHTKEIEDMINEQRKADHDSNNQSI